MTRTSERSPTFSNLPYLQQAKSRACACSHQHAMPEEYPAAGTQTLLQARSGSMLACCCQGTLTGRAVSAWVLKQYLALGREDAVVEADLLHGRDGCREGGHGARCAQQAALDALGVQLRQADARAVPRPAPLHRLPEHLWKCIPQPALPEICIICNILREGNLQGVT